MANVLINNITDTWNSAGTTFTGIKFNVTDTASAAGSLLMDLQVGGVSKFKVDKNGNPITGNGYVFDQVYGIRKPSGNIDFTLGGSNTQMTIYSGGPILNRLTFSISNVDLVLERDLANTLAQRNGVNSQTSRLYGTYTDASNYRRLTKTMSAAGVAEIKPEGVGTGATGNVLYISGLPTSNPGPGILWNNGGVVNVGT